MKKLKRKIAIKLLDFGLWVMRLGPKSEFDDEDRNNVTKLYLLRKEIMEQK